MINKYFDEFRLNELMKTKNSNPTDAIIKYEKYIEEYPEDYTAIPYYVDALVSLKQMNKAEQVLKELKNNMDNDQHYQINKDKVKRDKTLTGYYFSKAKLLCFQNKFEECYELVCINKKFINKNKANIDALLLYLQYKLGLVEGYIYPEDYYAFNQIINYSEERFLNHMKRHLETEELMLDDENEKSSAVFNEEFPFVQVFEELKRIIPSDKVLYFGLVNDVYYVKYDFCGKVNGKLVDFFRVVLYHDTNQYITMYPIETGRYFDYIDLNYLKENDEAKVKRKNQIEKFNQKYRL